MNQAKPREDHVFDQLGLLRELSKILVWSDPVLMHTAQWAYVVLLDTCSLALEPTLVCSACSLCLLPPLPLDEVR